MNNDKLKQIIFILVVIIVLLFTTLAIVITTHLTRKQPVSEQKTIIISDTITNVIYDTVFIKEYKTVKLPVDTLYIDTVRIDSIFVQVPISVYKLDTVFKTDTTRLDLFIQNSGFDVKLDSLYYRLEYCPTPPVKLPKKNYFREHLRFGVGVSAGYGFFSKQPDIFVGLGFHYVF